MDLDQVSSPDHEDAPQGTMPIASQISTVDAVVIGSGHNGLVAAALLAQAGWTVTVLERNDHIGGAVRSDEVTLPGFVHDVYSMNQNLFLASAAYAELRDDLERHGLEYVVSDKPFCNVFPDGRSRRIYTDVERTLREIRVHDAKDADGFERLHERYRELTEKLLPLYGTPLPSFDAVKALAAAARNGGIQDLVELVQLVLSSTRELGDDYFATEEMKALIATWGMHMDFGPDVSAGAQFPLLEVFGDMENGMAIVKGGASKMPEALAGIITEHGGTVRTGAEVVEVTTTDGRATGVRLVSGEVIEADRVVIANLTPTVLFDRLLASEHLPEGFRRKVDRYTYGPGTMMVHLALRDRPSWVAGEDIADFAYVHIAPYVSTLAHTYTSALNGELPADPLLIVGQPTTMDPARTPGDEHILWVQVRALPADIRADALQEIEPAHWDDVKEAYADRVMAKLEAYAPGIGDLVLARTVLSPIDLERDNPNLHGGDSLAGSLHLSQNFLFRPFAGWSNYDMPVDGLVMVGAATWPGAGTNGGSGYLAAQQLLAGPSLKDRVVGSVTGVVAKLRRN